jgi:murein DD-endopeptidase MepM/ murein hydrolase activator NlpD
MIRKIAWIALLIVAGYGVWVITLNLPGHGPAQSPAGSPAATSGPVKTIKVDSTPSAASGSLIVPVAGVTPGQLVDSFNDKRGDGSRIHGAIDIMAPRGTLVLAAAAGIVEKLFDSKLGGLTIYIRRRDGAWVDYYAHLDSYAPGLAEGQRVVQGQMIALVGSTGDASPEGPHLHFEVKAMAPGEGWWQGTAVDPFPLLGGR